MGNITICEQESIVDDYLSSLVVHVILIITIIICMVSCALNGVLIRALRHVGVFPRGLSQMFLNGSVACICTGVLMGCESLIYLFFAVFGVPGDDSCAILLSTVSCNVKELARNISAECVLTTMSMIAIDRALSTRRIQKGQSAENSRQTFWLTFSCWLIPAVLYATNLANNVISAVNYPNEWNPQYIVCTFRNVTQLPVRQMLHVFHFIIGFAPFFILSWSLILNKRLLIAYQLPGSTCSLQQRADVRRNVEIIGGLIWSMSAHTFFWGLVILTNPLSDPEHENADQLQGLIWRQLTNIIIMSHQIAHPFLCIMCSGQLRAKTAQLLLRADPKKQTAHWLANQQVHPAFKKTNRVAPSSGMDEASKMYFQALENDWKRCSKK